METSTMKGTPWSTPTIEKALKLRLSCGSRGYNVVRETGTPLPAERTLQRQLEKFKFAPGILHEILDSLAVKVSLMEDHERHAVLMFGEIQLKHGLSYYQASGRIIGRPTISLANGALPKDAMAKKGFVFMLGDVTTRWKQTIAYHFTGNSFSSTKLKEALLSILRECEKIGLRVDAIVCYMGGGI
ncbi:uncharacterized protein ISCGN_014384 [Ixodes scapularis]